VQTLSGKRIFITGGTSTLGEAFVKNALQSGAAVYFTYFQNQAKAQELTAEGAHGLCADLRKSGGIEQILKDIKSKETALDILIHNAALVRDHTLQNMTEEDWDEVMAVNVKAAYLLVKAFLPLMFRASRANGQAKIFFMTSRVAVRGGFGVANYAASKAALNGLMKSLAKELGKKNILVNAVNPGFMMSGMTRGLPEIVIENNLQATPLGKASSPGEVGGLLTYLCSDAMTQVTGQVLNFEGREIV